MRRLLVLVLVLLGSAAHAQAPTPLAQRLEQAKDAMQKAERVMLATDPGQAYVATVRLFRALEADVAAEKSKAAKPETGSK